MPNSAVTEPFSLAGMGEMLRETNPALAAETNVDEVEPPKIEASPDPADALPEGEIKDKPAAEGAEKETADDGNPTAEELEAEQERQKQEADGKKAEVDAQKAKDDAEAAKKAAEAAGATKTPEQEEREKRDADLKDQLSPHTHPKTRKVIEAKNAKIQEARNERDRIAAEREQLKKERDELAEKAKGVSLPKEVDEELKTLRERVRELDITRDPQLEAKYDKPMVANTRSALELLKRFGADQIADPKDSSKTTSDPRFEVNFLKTGLSLKVLQPFIEKLDKGGFIDEAEELREAVRENGRLARGKQQEVESWKSNYESRIQSRTQQNQQQGEAEQKAMQTETDTVLKTELAELSKSLPFINPPPAPLQTDTEAVRKVKQQALDEYNAAAKQVSDTVAAFNNTGKTPEQARAAGARFSANAILGVIAKSHAIPTLLKQAAAKDARIKELETQLGRFKGATTLSKQHASIAGAAPQQGDVQIPANAATSDAFAAFAKANGVNVGS